MMAWTTILSFSEQKFAYIQGAKLLNFRGVFAWGTFETSNARHSMYGKFTEKNTFTIHKDEQTKCIFG